MSATVAYDIEVIRVAEGGDSVKREVILVSALTQDEAIKKALAENNVFLARVCPQGTTSD